MYPEYHIQAGNIVRRIPAIRRTSSQPGGRSSIRNEAVMSKRNPTRGIPLSRADQWTIVAVAVGILIVTGFLVGLLF